MHQLMTKQDALLPRLDLQEDTDSLQGQISFIEAAAHAVHMKSNFL